MLFLRRLPPNEAWLLVFFDGTLTAVFSLRRRGGDDPGAPHGRVVVRPVRHRVQLIRAKSGAKRSVRVPDAVRKHPLAREVPSHVLQRVAAQGVKPPDFSLAQGLGPVHVVRVQVRVTVDPGPGPNL